jgi:hypothetical protein
MLFSAGSKKQEFGGADGGWAAGIADIAFLARVQIAPVFPATLENAAVRVRTLRRVRGSEAKR